MSERCRRPGQAIALGVVAAADVMPEPRKRRESEALPDVQSVRVTLVVINYLTPQLTVDTVREAVASHHNPHVDLVVIVVDNSPDDSRRARNPMAALTSDGIATVVDAPSNLGFSGGANLGATFGHDDDFIWFLNSDAVASADALDELIRVAGTGYSIVGSQLLTPDGRVESCGGDDAIRRGLVRHQSSGKPPVSHPSGGARVPWVHGASFLIARDAWTRLGGFDERFFLYFEEADLCFRAQEMGLSSAIAYRSIVSHEGGASIRQAGANDLRDIYFTRNYLLFFSQHLRPPLRWLTALGWCITVVLARAARGEGRRIRLHVQGTLAYWRKDFGRLNR